MTLRLMMLRSNLICLMAVYGLVGLSPSPSNAADGPSNRFREVLELAGIGPQTLSQLSEGPDYADDEWQTLLQVFKRLDQFRALADSLPVAKSFPPAWINMDSQSIAELFCLRGQIVSVERISLPEHLTKLTKIKTVYRCEFKFVESEKTDSENGPAKGADHGTVDVLSTHIPRVWQSKVTLSEPVELRGVVARLQSGEDQSSPLLLTNHIAWYPTAGTSSGQLLLARHGMDVALLDEVVHRQPFVKPEVSREGEAFYAGLNALGQVDTNELFQEAQQNVAPVAEQWRSRQAEFRRNHQKLVEQLSQVSEGKTRDKLIREVRRAKTRMDLAATIANQAALGQSSVATMFLQPEKEVGKLFVFDGMARRAVRIAVEQQLAFGRTGELEAYYEIEIYPLESRLLKNRPIVCCVSQLPPNFPTGDEIRVPVRMAGVFFKSWRYRSRGLVQIGSQAEEDGQTERQPQLYTPVLLGKSPIWLKSTFRGGDHWAFWGGVTFLSGLAVMWISMTWLARRDRRARMTLRRTETIDLGSSE